MRRTTILGVLFVLIATTTAFAADIPDRPEKLVTVHPDGEVEDLE